MNPMSDQLDAMIWALEAHKLGLCSSDQVVQLGDWIDYDAIRVKGDPIGPPDITDAVLTEIHHELSSDLLELSYT